MPRTGGGNGGHGDEFSAEALGQRERLMEKLEVVRTYLEMHAPRELRPAVVEDPRLRVERVVDCPSSFFRYLYREVGRNHHWVDRLEWSDAQIRSYLDTLGVDLWLLSFEGAPAGYFELRRCDDGSTEIAYFGLLPEFKGRGFGKHLLTQAAQTAWADGAQRVWLHTCTLDDSAALPNYEKRGFRPFRRETYWVEAPAPTPVDPGMGSSEGPDNP